MPMRCESMLQVGVDQTLEIKSYYDPYTNRTDPTTVRFSKFSGIRLGFVNDPSKMATLLVDGQQSRVFLASLDYNGIPNATDENWIGIDARYYWPFNYLNPSSYNITLKRCCIYSADYGVNVALPGWNNMQHNLEIDDCMISYSREYGVYASNSNLNLHNSVIDHTDHHSGVDIVGYSFYGGSPNKIEGCTIMYNNFSGLEVSNHRNNYNPALGMSNKLLVTGNWIEDNKRHGVHLNKSILTMTYNRINNNGWDQGVPVDDGYCGTWVDESILSYHANVAQHNSAYGLQADNGSYVQGNFIAYYSDSENSYGPISSNNILLEGRNCFLENDFNVGTSCNRDPNARYWENTKIYLGLRKATTETLPIQNIGHNNSFSSPTKFLLNTTTFGQMTAEQSSTIWAYRNYWTPGLDVGLYSNGKIYSDFNYYANYDVCRGYQTGPQGGVSSQVNYSDNAEMIQARIMLGLTDEAVTMSYNNVDDSMDSTELSIKMLAFRSAYVYNHNEDSRDTLRKYAFRPFNPGEAIDFITSTALIDLVTAEMLMDNVEGAILAIDSIVYRTVPEEVRIKYIAKRAEILVSDAGDLSQIAVIDSLLVLYPDNKNVINAKYLISQDTAYYKWLPKEKWAGNRNQGATRSEIATYPNPSTSHSKMQISSTEELKQVKIYDYLGRQIEETWFKIEQNKGNVSITHSLKPGTYFIMLTTAKSTKFARFVVSK